MTCQWHDELHVADNDTNNEITVTPQHDTDLETELDYPRKETGTTDDTQSINCYIYLISTTTAALLPSDHTNWKSKHPTSKLTFICSKWDTIKDTIRSVSTHFTHCNGPTRQPTAKSHTYDHCISSFNTATGFGQHMRHPILHETSKDISR